jgi:hypothetical protein
MASTIDLTHAPSTDPVEDDILTEDGVLGFGTFVLGGDFDGDIKIEFLGVLRSGAGLGITRGIQREGSRDRG